MRVGRNPFRLSALAGVGACCLALLFTAGVATPSSQVAAVLEVVASGLDNPRGLAFSPEGALNVAEAGRGGEGACIPLPEAGATGERCYGATGAITRVWPLEPGTQRRVATGLPSLAPEGGNEAGGPVDIAFLGRGHAQVIVGFGGHPDDRAELGLEGDGFGHLYQVPASGRWRRTFDVAAHELGDPDGAGADSNPYSVVAQPGRQVVADAGGNSLVEVRADGTMRTLAVFEGGFAPAPPFLGLPPGTEIPYQAVPTSVAEGPGGDLYVGQLTGFPFPVGRANVYRVPRDGGVPEVVADGFTNIIDIAFDRSGNLYVLEFAKNGLLAGPQGRLTRVDPQGARTVLVDDDLFAPGGIAIARDGTIYLTRNAILAGAGQVVRVTFP